MNPDSIVFNNFLGHTFEEFIEQVNLADICFDSNKSMTEFYNYCIDHGVKAIKIDSNESPKYYHLQYLISDSKSLEKLKLLTLEITSNS